MAVSHRGAISFWYGIYSGNLMDIKDHYHKYVVCKDALAIGNDNGIEIVHIADFLLKDKW